jgi:hypothetical protein
MKALTSWLVSSWLLYATSGTVLLAVALRATPTSSIQYGASIVSAFLGMVLIGFNLVPFVKLLTQTRRRRASRTAS